MPNQIFADRRTAGSLLAERFTQSSGLDDAMVLALPRGGVPVAYEIASKLQLPLDIMLVRKLGVPGHEEFAMGAIASGGIEFLDKGLMAEVDIKPEAVTKAREAQMQEIRRRELAYRGNRPLLELGGRNVILVDDGLATGASMRVAVAAVRRQQARNIIIAVPVAPRDTLEKFVPLVDEIICLSTPHPFFAVGQWYGHFNQVSDEDVCRLLALAWQHNPA
jgi:putative phosphoribosyl transferase